MIETGAVEALDAVGHEQVSIGDHTGNDAVFADAGDDLVEFWVQQWLTAGDGDDVCAQAREVVDAPKHLIYGDFFREIIVLVAVSAGEIAASHRDDVRHYRMVGRGQGAGDHGELAQTAPRGLSAATRS